MKRIDNFGEPETCYLLDHWLNEPGSTVALTLNKVQRCVIVGEINESNRLTSNDSN